VAERSNQRPPPVRLGRLAPDGVAPSMFGLLERGAERRPKVARRMRGRVVFRFDEGFSPLRLTFAASGITVADGDFRDPDLTISGSLPDIIHFATAPLVGGVPNPARGRGRAALAHVASRRVQLEGRRALARPLLQLLAL
jgi:hypothetical protein